MFTYRNFQILPISVRPYLLFIFIENPQKNQEICSKTSPIKWQADN